MDKFEINSALVPLSGVDNLYRVAKTVHLVDSVEVDRVVKYTVSEALLWMALQLKSPNEQSNPNHFGRIVTISPYYLQFGSTSDGVSRVTPVICGKKPALNAGWVRSIKLGSDLMHSKYFPELPFGSWTEGMYLKLFDEPVLSPEQALAISGVLVPIPNSQVYDPNLSLN